MTKDETVRWHHRLSEHEFEQTPGDSKGRGSLVCCSPWCCRAGHGLATEQQQQKGVLMSYSSRVDCTVFENEVPGI